MNALLLLVLVGGVPSVDTPNGPVVARSAWCASCHPAQAERWKLSRHALAGTNRLYLANHSQEPMHWCDGCHVPTGEVNEGVGCASCHVREGAIFSTKAPTEAGARAHRGVEVTRDEAWCESCHQVNFPVGKSEPVTLSNAPMQNTVEEWRASGSKKTCLTCHLPKGEHLITGGHDLARVRRALKAEVTRLGSDELRLTVRNELAAHSVPTGDPFRAFELELCTDESCEFVVARHRFGRTITPTGPSWRITRDWTIPAVTERGPGERSFDVARPEQARWWRLSLRYVGDSTAPLLTPVEVSAELFSGAVPGTRRVE